MNALCQRTLYAPLGSVDPLENGGVADSSFSGPISQRHGSAIVRKQGVGSLVVALFNRRGPSAVGRLIVAIHINAVNGVLAARALAHVCKEAVKRFPSWRVGDTSTSVVGPLVVPGVGASGFHVAPAVVSSSPVSTIGVAVRQASRNSAFDIETSTGYGFPEGETARCNRGGCTALTNAIPMRSSAPILGSINDNPAPKTPSGKVLKFCHDGPLNLMLNYSKLRLGLK